MVDLSIFQKIESKKQFFFNLFDICNLTNKLDNIIDNHEITDDSEDLEIDFICKKL